MRLATMATAESSVVGSKKAGRADGWLAANSAGRSMSRTPLPSARKTASSFPRSAISVISMKASRFITGLAKASLWRQPPRWPPTRLGIVTMFIIAYAPQKSLLGARHSSGASSFVDHAAHERHWSGALPAMRSLVEPVRYRGQLRQGNVAKDGVTGSGLLQGRRDAVADRADPTGAAVGEFAASCRRRGA